MSPFNESDLIDQPAQADLFGSVASAREAYVPDQRHVRNRLEDLVAQMQAATAWPWESSIVSLHREKTFSYLCDLLADREEAADWRLRIAAEISRLDATAG